MATVDRVLVYACAELGKSEIPANSNRTPYGKWYGMDGQPWCMMFVQWVFYQAGMPLPHKTASCSDLLNWYRKNKPSSVQDAVPNPTIKTSPRPGDIVIYNFGHTGIVESISGDNITVIEGNTSPDISGSQSNGGMVCRKIRKMSSATAYIRPDYTQKVTQDNNPSPAHKEGVEWAQKNGILTGNASGDLMLSQGVTRQQLCTILFRFAKFLGKA